MGKLEMREKRESPNRIQRIRNTDPIPIDYFIEALCEEIEKVENPYDDEIGWHSEQEAFEGACQKILSLLKE